MRKKIYDIIPPAQVTTRGEVEEEPEELEIEVKEEPAFKKQKFKKPRKPMGKGFLLVIFLVIAAAVVGGIYMMTDTKSEIVITPKLDKLSAEREVAIVLEGGEMPEAPDRFIMTGRVIEEEKEYSKNLPATGTADGGGYAKGTIKVSAKTAPMTLREGTRFQSEKNGKIYRVKKSITIPAGTDGNPGILEVEVVADEPGEEYNVEGTKFTLPALKEQKSELFDTTWAESVTAISGGSKGENPAVSASDLLGAEQKFKEQVLGDAISSLSGNIPEGYLVLESATTQTVSDFKKLAKEGDKVNQFDVSGKVKTRLVIVKTEDVSALLRSVAGVDESSNFGYANEDISVGELSESGGKYETKVSVSADYYDFPSNEDIIGEIALKSKDEAISILNKDGKAEKVEIKTDPSWKAVVSSNKENINIRFELVK
jgi:hypothetical protein